MTTLLLIIKILIYLNGIIYAGYFLYKGDYFKGLVLMMLSSIYLEVKI